MVLLERAHRNRLDGDACLLAETVAELWLHERGEQADLRSTVVRAAGAAAVIVWEQGAHIMHRDAAAVVQAHADCPYDPDDALSPAYLQAFHERLEGILDGPVQGFSVFSIGEVRSGGRRLPAFLLQQERTTLFSTVVVGTPRPAHTS